MRPKSLALLLLALGCGLVASIGITEVIARRNAEPVGPIGQNVSIFVAMTDIGLGELLTPQMLKLEQWPKDKVPTGALSKLEDVEGRRSRTRIYANEPILENRLLPKGASEQGATAQIPKGYRVVPVKVDLVSGGSSLILPGDRVDVMVHLVRDPRRDIHETVTRTILQDIKVFAVNDVMDLEQQKDGSTHSINAKTISLLVTPEQAAKVMLATQMGTVNLVMRSSEDDQQGPNIQVRPGELFGAGDRSDRDKETPGASGASLAERAKSFTDFLVAMKAKAAAAPKTSPEKQTWTMRILKPGEVENVKFESEAAAPGEWKSAPANAPADEPPPPAEPADAPATVVPLPPVEPAPAATNMEVD